MMDLQRASVVGVVLCGGAGARLGGGKPLREIAGLPMAGRVANVLRPHVDGLAIAGDPDAARTLGLESLQDPPLGLRGPLAGILAGLEWARGRGADWLAVAPCDTPLLPDDLLPRLLASAVQASANSAFADTIDGPHPLVAVWRTWLATPLRTELTGGHPAVHRLLARLGAERVRFEDVDAFMNVNTPGDLSRAEALLARR